MQVSPINFKALADVLAVEGFDPAAALRRCGFGSLDELDDRGPWLPASLFDALMAAALEVTGDAGFGLVAGRSKALMRYVTLLQVTLVAPHLRQVIADIRRYAPLFVDQSELELVEQSSTAQVYVKPVVEQGLSGRFRTEQVATSAAHMLRHARGGPADILLAEFPYPCPAGQEARYAAIFGPNLRFGRRHCSIAFERRLLDVPLSTHDPAAYAAARAVAESALAARRSGSPVAERVRRCLLQALPQQPSIQQTAQQLKMSERSLRRQLAASGITYAELTQQCHRLTAEQLLANRELSIKQITEQLGFASVASFHRAFRRWTDMTPVEWRSTGEALRVSPVMHGQ
jgi:AraC-like DNA-binding protein